MWFKRNWLLIVFIIIPIVVFTYVMATLGGWEESLHGLSSLEKTVVLVKVVLFVIGMPILYFTPSIVAYAKRKMNKGAILALNTLAGFTVVGWVVALVWALTKDNK